MPTKTAEPLRPDVEQSHTDQQAAPAVPATGEVLARIRRDSLDEPEQYVDEIHVRGSGE